MRTLGLIHRIETNGAVTSSSVEAESAQPALTVFRSDFGSELTPEDLTVGNTLPDLNLESISWGQWQRLNPITVIGASALRTTDTAADSAVSGAGTARSTVSVLAGPDSGFTLTLDPRRACLSRLPHAECLTIIDPCISRTPQPLNLDATGAQRALHLGATVLTPGTADCPSARPSTASAGSVPQIRSPPLHRNDDIHIAPKTIDDPRPARPPQWWTFLIPIGIGVLLAVATGMWWFLLFSVSAPLSGWVAYLVEKKRFARDSAQCRLDRDEALAEARTRLSRLEARHRAAIFSAPGLCVGFGTIFSDLTVDETLHEGTDHVEGRVVFAEMPIRIDPRTTTLTVRGDPDVLRTMAFAWLADHRFNWQPGPELALLPELAGTEFSADRCPDTPRSESRPGSIDDPIVLTLDEAAHPAVLTLGAPHAGSTVAMTVGTLAQARTTSSTAPGGPVPGRALIATLMPAARFVALHSGRTTETGPRAWPSHGLGDLCDDAPEAIRARWRSPASGKVLIGRGGDGDVGIDLFGDGPHALVAGTTGSGKSLLLQTWLLAMALAQPPRRLRFVLIDFKGGATFAPLLDLPHTDSVLDDFDSGLAFRALVSVRAEITRRERLLADHGCADVADLADPPPRLVVVIDEFHALMASHPRAADLLEHLTALGRSLGVHLILATQRPLGVVTGQMKANINIRVCLRVRDATDSIDVIGTEAGALLPADQPGAACLDSGTSLCEFRTAVPFGTDARPEAALRPRVRVWGRGPVPSLAGGIAGVHVENIIAAAEDSSVPQQRQVVLPPLPELDDLVSGEPTLSLTGLIDVPGEQRQEQWVFDPDVDGSVMLTGGESDVVDAVLMRMAHSAAATRRIIAVGTIASALDWAEIACGMTSGWRIQAVLEHLTPERTPTAHPPSLLVCGNWEEVIDSLDHHWADRLERLLSHGAGPVLGFLLAGCRSSTSRSSRFATQIVFPPVTGEDGLSVGLSRQRFAGRWPDFRAVIRGPRALSAGGDGADVQLVPEPDEHGSDDVVGRRGDRVSFEPRWHGLKGEDKAGVPDGLVADFTAKAGQSHILLGVDAFGEVVEWDPVREGSVLTVRGSAQSGKSECAELITSLGSGEVAVHDDAHQSAEPVEWDLQDGRPHVLTLPLRFSPGYGSPLAKAQDLGPLLVLGVHTRHDLTNLGLIRQAPLDGIPGTGWFVTEDRARAIRLFTRDEVETFSQLSSAGGPERVS